MDSDCLVKLAQSGAKEAVIVAMEVHIPFLVKKETVDEGRRRGYQDALIIEENINKKALHMAKHRSGKPPAISSAKGETDVVSLYMEGDYDAVASDDQRFLKRLEAAGIPYLTPASCVVYVHKSKKIDKAGALGMLEPLKPFISREEYAVAKLYLEEKP